MAQFNEEFYLENNPEALASGKTAFEHYVTEGWESGAQANAEGEVLTGDDIVTEAVALSGEALISLISAMDADDMRAVDADSAALDVPALMTTSFDVFKNMDASETSKLVEDTPESLAGMGVDDFQFLESGGTFDVGQTMASLDESMTANVLKGMGSDALEFVDAKETFDLGAELTVMSDENLSTMFGNMGTESMGFMDNLSGFDMGGKFSNMGSEHLSTVMGGADFGLMNNLDGFDMGSKLAEMDDVYLATAMTGWSDSSLETMMAFEDFDIAERLGTMDSTLRGDVIGGWGADSLQTLDKASSSFNVSEVVFGNMDHFMLMDADDMVGLLVGMNLDDIKSAAGNMGGNHLQFLDSAASFDLASTMEAIDDGLFADLMGGWDSGGLSFIDDMDDFDMGDRVAKLGDEHMTSMLGSMDTSGMQFIDDMDDFDMGDRMAGMDDQYMATMLDGMSADGKSFIGRMADGGTGATGDPLKGSALVGGEFPAGDGALDAGALGIDGGTGAIGDPLMGSTLVGGGFPAGGGVLDVGALGIDGGADGQSFNDVNENPPTDIDLTLPNGSLYEIKLYSGSMYSGLGYVDENVVGTVIGTLSTTDLDVGDTHSYSLSGVGSDLFEVDSSSQLKLKDGVSLDYETQSSYNLTVTATDSGGLSRSEGFYVNVEDVVEIGSQVPTDISLTLPNGSLYGSKNDVTSLNWEGYIDENATGTVIGTLGVVDTDSPDGHSFSLSGNGSDLFEVDSSNQLKLKDGVSLDYETQSSYNLTVSATDSGGLSYDERFVVNVESVVITDTEIIRLNGILYNQTPGYTYLSNFRTVVAQNGINEFANTLAANFALQTDVELAAIVTGNLGLTGDALTAVNTYVEAQFAVNPANRGQVALDFINTFLTLESDADYGSAAVAFNSKVIASLEYSTISTNTEVISFDITDTVNQTATGITLDSLSVAENSVGAHVANITGTDPDGDALTYSIAGGADAALFEISISGDMLHLATGISADYETTSQLEVELQAIDSEGLIYQNMFTIMVEDVVEVVGSPSSEPDSGLF